MRDLGGGWNVAVALAHAAFWDRRAAYGLQRWATDGTDVNADDDDTLNQALLDQWQAIPPRAALRLALEAARAVDATVAALPDRTASLVTEAGLQWLLRRAGHRREHIDQIQAALEA